MYYGTLHTEKGFSINYKKGEIMFQLDLKSRKSIYEQVMDNLKELIMTDVLASESKLPSVRELSKYIAVNPNTVQKAYRELERQGYVYTVSGVGTFVTDKKDIVLDSVELEKVKAKLLDAFKQLMYMGLDFDKAKEVVLSIINGEECLSCKGGKKDD